MMIAYHLVTDGARFLKKKRNKIGSLNLGPKLGPTLGVFLSFSQIWCLSFFEIACNDSLQQCLTYCRGKIYEKKFWGSKFGPKGRKSCPELGFLPFSQVWFISFP